MAIDLRTTLERQIKNKASTFNTNTISNSLAQAKSQKALGETSLLGNTANETKNGFKALNAALDDVQSNLPASSLQQQTGRLVISQLTADVDIKDKIIKTPTEKSSIQSITGAATTASEALLDAVVTIPTAEAIAANVKKVVDELPSTFNAESLSISEISSIAKKMVDFKLPLENITIDMGHIGDATETLESDIEGVINNAIGGKLSSSSVLTKLVSNISSEYTKVLNLTSKGYDGLINNMVEDFLAPLKTSLSSLNIKGKFSEVENRLIRQAVQRKNIKDLENVSKLLQKYTTKSYQDIFNTLSNLDVSAFKNIIQDQANTVKSSQIALDLGKIANSWNGINTPKSVFTVVSSKEELEAEILSCTREITEVVFHWSNTGTNQNLTAIDLHEQISNTYDVPIPYHYVICRDGNLQRGRPIRIVSNDVELPNGHNDKSIHVCLVGGVNKPTGKNTLYRDTVGYLSKQSYTVDQWKVLEKFIAACLRAFPGMQFLGHNDIDLAELDPGFDVGEYVQSTFGVSTFFQDASSQPPFTREQISLLTQSDQVEA